MVSLICSQCEIERCPFAHMRLGPDAAAVPMDHPLHGGQPNAGSWKLAGFVQALEGCEKHSGIRHIKSHAVIANKEGTAAVGLRSSKLHPGGVAQPSELHRILQQIGHRDLE